MHIARHSGDIDLDLAELSDHGSHVPVMDDSHACAPVMLTTDSLRNR